MKFVRIMVAAIVGLAGAAGAAGWEELFNGRDLTGWDPQSKVDWRVEFRNIRIQKLGLP